MPLGLYSLDARIELMRRAQRSLDVQYYLVEDDRTGRLFLRSLRDAALRGVRVRLLVDDLNTAGADELFSGLAAFPNVEVRLFNPFCCARRWTVTRFAASMGDLPRLNHRMHNKLFIADGAFAVMGGRNIADEYFSRSAISNYVDMDVLLAGAVLDPLARIFDEYWNSPQAYPAAAILGLAADARETFDRRVEEGDQMRSVAVPARDMLGQAPLGKELDAGRVSFATGRAVAFADQPLKVMATSPEMARSLSVQMNVMDRAARSAHQVVISSPYFVPGKDGVATLAELVEHGVEVVVLTNSFAANDQPLVHIGYARYRAALLRAGVDLYELSHGRLQVKTGHGVFGLAHGRLHAKVAVFDASAVYIGSMNLDPRSEGANTELGLFVNSSELASDVLRVINSTRHAGTYQVRLGTGGKSLEWHPMADPQAMPLASEPEANLFSYFLHSLLAPFVPEQLL
jgi:putative cardiolipin synthase